MRSGWAGAERLCAFWRGDTPHNREAGRLRRLAGGEAPQGGQRDQMSLCSPLSPWTRGAETGPGKGGSSSLTETYSAPVSLAVLLQPAPSSTPLAATR